MARKTTKQVEAIEDEVEELEELDDAIEVADADDDGGDLLSAKEAATRIGTDARTLRKFLRKKNGLVGQGNRWAIDVEDLDALKTEFNAWAKGNKAASDEKKAKAKVTAPPADDDAFEEIDDDDLEELEV